MTMEYQRSFWSRLWENDSLDQLSRDYYVRSIYEEDRRPWNEIYHGVILSMWKGVKWLFKGKN